MRKPSQTARPVYGMQRVFCLCCNSYIWAIQYKKGEVKYENDFGKPRPTYISAEDNG
jgi:hypothetical protein